MSRPLTITAPEGLPFVEFEREFDAPVTAVFGAHRDPELLVQWLGPDGYNTDIQRYDFVTQGGYRYVQRTPEGQEFGFHGVFHVVRDQEFVIQTFEFEGFPDVVSIESLTFTDLGDGHCRLTGHAAYPSLEARDGMVASGMEGGMAQGYRRLDALVAPEPA